MRSLAANMIKYRAASGRGPLEGGNTQAEAFGYAPDTLPSRAFRTCDGCDTSQQTRNCVCGPNGETLCVDCGAQYTKVLKGLPDDTDPEVILCEIREACKRTGNAVKGGENLPKEVEVEER